MNDYPVRLEQALVNGSTGAIKAVSEWILNPSNRIYCIPAIVMLQIRSKPVLSTSFLDTGIVPTSTTVSPPIIITNNNNNITNISSVPMNNNILTDTSKELPPINPFLQSLHALYIGNDIYFTAINYKKIQQNNDYIDYVLSILPPYLDTLLTSTMNLAKTREEHIKVATISELWYRYHVLPPPSSSSSSIVTTSVSSIEANSLVPSSSNIHHPIIPIPNTSSSSLLSTSAFESTTNNKYTTSIPSNTLSFLSTVDITTLPVGYMVTLFHNYQKHIKQYNPPNSWIPYTPLPSNIIGLPRSDITIEPARLEVRIRDYIKIIDPLYKPSNNESKTYNTDTASSRKRHRGDLSKSNMSPDDPKLKRSRESYLRHAFDRFYQDNTNNNNNDTETNSTNITSTNEESKISTNIESSYTDLDRYNGDSEFRGLGFSK